MYVDRFLKVQKCLSHRVGVSYCWGFSIKYGEWKNGSILNFDEKNIFQIPATHLKKIERSLKVVSISRSQQMFDNLLFHRTVKDDFI